MALLPSATARPSTTPLTPLPVTASNSPARPLRFFSSRSAWSIAAGRAEARAPSTSYSVRRNDAGAGSGGSVWIDAPVVLVARGAAVRFEADGDQLRVVTEPDPTDQETVPPLIEAMAHLPRASDVIVGEPTMLRAVTGHKGGVTYWVHVHGYEVHSSLLYRGVSAIMWGAKLIDWANRMNAQNMAKPPTDLAAIFEPPFTTLHVGQIEGGTAHNITAKDCRFGLDFRVVPGEDLADWEAAMMEEARRIEAEMQAISSRFSPTARGTSPATLTSKGSRQPALPSAGMSGKPCVPVITVT